MRTRSLATLVLAGLLVAATPAAARADEGETDEDVRVEVSCSQNSELRVRLRTRDDDTLQLVLEVRSPRLGARWAVVVVHERRLVTRRIRRTNLMSGSFVLRRAIPDWPGRDSLSVRAVGPRGELCRASATVQGDG
jgi:hypothetical protein